MSLETEITHAPEDNPFFRTSTLPYQLPPFELIRMEHYRPAFDKGMADRKSVV